MKAWIAVLLSGCSLLVLNARDFVEPGLPAWEDGGQARTDWIAGASLLAEETKTVQEEQTAEDAIEVAEPSAEEIAGAETPSDEIPEKFWPEYFEARPQSFLVDPQNLLGVVDYRDRLGFLNYHAGDSSIDLFVYLFEGDQEIPGELREEELAERLFAEGRPAVVVYYFMGAPQRSLLYLSPSLTDAVSPVEQRRAMQSSVMQAFRHVEPTRQLEAFLVQMSIRIYWMERLAGSAKDEVASMDAPVVREDVETAEETPSQTERAALIDEALGMLPAGGGLCGVLLAGWLGIVWMRNRARYRFPDFEVEPRLGGAHAAGVGAVISFASAAVPPASQRDQVPDYLRRA